ncbi:hypothetical protein [Halorussus lipolyticus]|uniref:hypothetical protein n=1 Tax=Halorussus lipolyticus TaxID=3034024 RepID=UPI0023E781FA|nr:hypothetical protein [Halorussus sp. DT80]
MASVRHHLDAIAETADEALSERSGSAVEDHEYREALESIRKLGGESAVDRLADDIERSIRQTETLPQAQSVRSLGRDICDEEGYEIPADSWFAR